jgi:hypothetical protein
LKTKHLPLGKKFLTRTTTRTFPPGVGLESTSWRAAGITATLSLARRDGLEAVDRNGTGEAVVETLVGVVMPVMADAPEDEAEEREAGPGPWPRW